jgi:hypothetical protein
VQLGVTKAMQKTLVSGSRHGLIGIQELTTLLMTVENQFTPDAANESAG